MYLLDGVSQVRHFSGISDTTVISDEDIVFYIESEESKIFLDCGIKFYSVIVQNELYDGDDTSALVLKNYPVISVEELVVDGTTIGPSDYYFYKDKGMIRLKNGEFESIEGLGNSYQNVSVSYTYGCPDFEDTSMFKVAQLLVVYTASRDVLYAAGCQSTSEQSGIRTEKLAEYSISYDVNGTYINRLKYLNSLISELSRSLGWTTGARIF